MAISKILYKSSESATPETWMDVTGNTSESSNMLSGTVGTKADGTSATGNIASKSSSDLTASGLTVTAQAGHYASDATKTLTDANLTAGNIKKDVEIFGVTGSYEGSGGTLITKAVSANGTYNASDDNVDGYSSVVVNVPQPTVSYTETPGPNGSTIVNINSTGISNEADVNFIDYDGTLVASRTKAEIDAMTSDSDLPANPTHTGLTPQGWNWTVAQLKAQLTAMPDQKVYVGQMYVTTDGKTEIDVAFNDVDYLSPYLSIAINGEVSVDWGDGSASDTMTGTSVYTSIYQQHVYTNIGNYTIKITVVSGRFSFFSSDGNYASILMATNESNNRSRNSVYTSCISAIRLGNSSAISTNGFRGCKYIKSITTYSSLSSIPDNAFYDCVCLKSITIPSGITTIGSNAFSGCYSIQNMSIPSSITNIKNYAISGCISLKYITFPFGITTLGVGVVANCYSLLEAIIPTSITTIGNSTFNNCQALQSASIKSNITNIGSGVFSNCYSLQSVIIPSSVTVIENTAFNSCVSLKNITIPSTVTSIGTSVFNGCSYLQSVTIPSSVASIGNQAFYGCSSLKSITIPSSVTSIGNSVFAYCYCLYDIHLKSTIPPTLGTSVFSQIQSGTIIYVPYSSDHSVLTAYQTATNWSTYASYMQEEVQ